jgi:hypothetical protein
MTAVEREGFTAKPAQPGQATKTMTLARALPPPCPCVDGSACGGQACEWKGFKERKGEGKKKHVSCVRATGRLTAPLLHNYVLADHLTTESLGSM